MRYSVLLIVIGIVVLAIAAFAPTLPGAMITITQTNTSGTLGVTSAMPEGTLTSPVQFENTSVYTFVDFITPTSSESKMYLSSPTIDSKAASLTINGQSVTPTLDVEIMSQTFTQLTSSNYVGGGGTTSITLYYVKAVVSYQDTYSGSMPSPTMAFDFSASVTVTGQFFGSSSTTETDYTGSYTGYGVFNVSTLQNEGVFYISGPGNYSTPQLITASSSFTFDVSSVPAPITFYYVESNGPTSGESSIYITINNVKYYIYENGVLENQTTVNGYTAGAVTVKLGNGTYTVNGYIQPSSSGSNAVQLMSFGMTLPNITTGSSTTTLTMAQIVEYIIGILFIILGAVEFYRGH